ncbi:hypothetical protein BUALT_Bualt10G0079700 [Buddleja alternifolia]|uniref:F-box domain-containing protein n=1 Tax=Buddleja alternifolia TaxID=168488 RepID=A0AAV6X7X8_9LAMI|nr:hypothetical protein BUALT_Bualt10G0079700 [Buddleja alternifolia]
MCGRIGVETEQLVSVSRIEDIPIAILLEIFLKLPVRAIIRCKSVCKSWFNLLSTNHPYFTNVYAKNSPFTALVLRRGVLETCRRVSEDGNSCMRTRFEPRVPDYLDAKSALYLISSSQGLLCLCEHKYVACFIVETVYISNPITAECIALRPHRVPYRNGNLILYEFGFSPSTNNFKYGVDSSWTKDYVILRSWFPSHLHFAELFPVAILRDGTILFKAYEDNCLCCCDPKKKKTATIKLQADVEVGRFKLISNFVKNYAPSFFFTQGPYDGKTRESSVNAKSK